jgi:hypothetical protein
MTTTSIHWGDSYREGITRTINDLYQSFRFAAAHELGEEYLRGVVDGVTARWAAVGSMSRSDIEEAERLIAAKIAEEIARIKAEAWAGGYA